MSVSNGSDKTTNLEWLDPGCGNRRPVDAMVYPCKPEIFEQTYEAVAP